MSAPQAPRRATSRPVCVLSVGRSGTSLVARVLDLLGVELGPAEGLIGPNPWNRRGFWEQRAIVALNDQILAALGGTYWSPPPRPQGWEGMAAMAPLRERAAALVEELFGDAPRWGFKDPRTVFTLPLWRAAVGEMDYVICVRHPREVVASLHGAYVEPGHEALLGLWLEANREALRQTAGARRLVVAYEDWFADRDATARRLAGFLGADLTPERRAAVRDAFAPTLRRERADRTPADLPPEALALHDLLRVLAAPEGPAASELAARLEGLAARRVELEAAHARRLAVVEALQSSASWRLTAPLRAIKQRLPRAR